MKILKFRLSAVLLFTLLVFCVPAFSFASDSGQPGDSREEESRGDSSAQAAVLVPDSEGSYYQLLPDRPGGSSVTCLILLPEEKDPEEFMEQTEWGFFSLMDGIDLYLLRTDWTDRESAVSYYESVCRQILQTSGETPVFLLGYEGAANFAVWEAALHTDRYTGLISLGGEGLSQDILDGEEFAENKSPLSVYFMASSKTSDLTHTLAYWKTRNRISGSALQSYYTRFADELYLPVTSTAGKIRTSQQHMGMVVFSRESELYTQEICANLTRNFLTVVLKDRICFRDSVTGGEVFGIPDIHFSYNRLQLEGQQRDYWIYVPDSYYRGTDPAKLILCLHGNGGNGQDMIIRTGWHETAAKENCIILYPSSLYLSGTQHYWQNSSEELEFLRYLVESVCSSYRIDRSRMYVTGFSNGAGMAQNLAVRCSDLFAAAAVSAPVYFDEEYYGPVEGAIHEVAILFSYGTEDPYLSYYHMTADIDDTPAIRHLEYWRALYGFAQEFYQCEKKGKFTIYTFRSQNFLPICQWIKVDGKKHEYPKEEVEIYYNFLKNYSKAENGDLYYLDMQVTSRKPD